jgi:hypothetical protein
VAAADAMRQAGEVPTDERRERLWRLWCEQGLQSPSYRPDLLAALPPPASLATYRWLWPREQAPEPRRAAWQLCEAVLQAHAGERDAARSNLQALLRALGPDRAQDRAAREAAALLKSLGA